MTKKILLCLLLSVILIFALVSCDAADGDEKATENKTAETETVEPDTEPIDTDTEISPDDGTETADSPEEEPRKIYVCIRFDGKYYAQIRKTAWPSDFAADLSFKYLGEIGEELENGDVIEGECVPKDTPVYLSEDGSFARVVFGGAVYYCELAEEPAPPETDEDGRVVTEAPGCISLPTLICGGELYKEGNFRGETWEFKLDGDWQFVGCIRSVVSSKMLPAYEMEANIDYFGKPVYYNEKLDRVAILVEDDNFAYSDIDWEIWIHDDVVKPE